jgi:hypothetical protein
MRGFLALTLFATACTSNSPAGGPSYDSVRERLGDGPTRMFIGTDGSSGTVTARRWTQGGWIEGVTPVTIESGELSAKADARGALTVDKFEVNLAPIAIPEEVFKKPASLHDVRVMLTKPATAQAEWTSDDDVTMQITLDLDFDWAILVNGSKTPLATQHLPPITIDVMVTGGGDHVDASVGLHAQGELWNWAGLLEMTSMDLALAGATTH